jgi:RimJ/RimL family protein N-acetyltransferase
MRRQISPCLLLVALFTVQSASAVQLRDGISLNELKCIDGEGVYLEALSEDTAPDIAKMMRGDLEDDYLDAYFESGRIDTERVKADVSNKLDKNRRLNFGQDRQFRNLSYVIRLKDSGEIVGLFEIYAGKGETEVELSVYVASGYAGQKVATRTVESALRALALKTTASEVIWRCKIKNEASNKLARRCGFLFSKAQLNHRTGNPEAHVYRFELGLVKLDPAVEVEEEGEAGDAAVRAALSLGTNSMTGGF